MIKVVFQFMTLMCDGLAALSPEHLRLCKAKVRLN